MVSIQALVDAAAPGAVVRVPPGIYRETVTVTKPLTLLAEPGAEIRGSDVWTGWVRQGAFWTRAGAPTLASGGECRDNGVRCRWANQVFLDGQPLRQVAARPGRGQFSLENGAIVLADDPTGRLVEVTVRPYWVLGGADDVTIQGFTMKHAGNPAQSGALHTRGYSRWTIRGNTLSDSHGPAVSLVGGAGHRLLGNDISRSGQLGVHGSDQTNTLVQGNRIYANNTEGFEPGWEAGGLKMARTTRLTLDGNEVYANDGPGLWCDIGCTDTTFSRNRVYGNQRNGISAEISAGVRVYGNTVWGNGWGFAAWGFGAGILCQNCADAEIYDNVVAWNADGISVIEQNRELVNTVTNVWVRDNTVVAPDGAFALAWLSDYGPYPLFNAGSNNRGTRNRYWFAGSEAGTPRFAWAGPQLSLASFNATLGGSGGRYLSDAEKEQVLAANRIPAVPVGRSPGPAASGP